MPSYARADSAVGVAPTLTVGQGSPAPRKLSAACRIFCALGIGGGGERLGIVQIVAFASMAEDALQDRVVCQDLSDLDQVFAVVPPDAGAMIVHVDLDQGGQALSGLPGVQRDGLGHLHRVQDDFQIDAAPAQLRDFGKLLRADAYGIEQVGYAVRAKNLRLLEGGDRRRTRRRSQHKRRGIQRLGALQMQPEGNAETGDAGAHPCRIFCQLPLIEQKTGRRHGCNCHGALYSFSFS